MMRSYYDICTASRCRTLLIALCMFYALMMTFVKLSAAEIIIRYQLDDFVQETDIQLSLGNTFELIYRLDHRLVAPKTTYADTLLFEGELPCIFFEVYDEGRDGISGDGFVELMIDGEQVSHIRSFGAYFSDHFMCENTAICQVARRINHGDFILSGQRNYWFEIDPFETRFYDIIVTSACVAKIWIYDECAFIHPSDQTGAIYFIGQHDSDILRINSFRCTANEDYFIRIELEDGCDTSLVSFVHLDLKEGCMDPTACDFDPLANIPRPCTFDDCLPDLIVDQKVFLESIFLDTFENDNVCLIEEGCLHGYGPREIIRFTTQIENIGQADFIVGPPEESSPFFSQLNCHNHWHFLGYAEYLLFDDSGSPQPIGFKNGFCALDFRCSDDLSYKYNCDYMGISAGCYDTYRNDLLCQWIDITDIEDGRYTLVVRVNHTRSKDLFGRPERSYDNNWAQACIEISRNNTGTSFVVVEDCETYTDCMGISNGFAKVDCEGICGGSSHFGDIDQNGHIDSVDLDRYKSILQDELFDASPCIDLDQDDVVSIYDLFLLETCISRSEEDHVHCDFPKSIWSPTDTVWLDLSKSEEGGAGHYQISYRSTTDVKGVTLSLQSASDFNFDLQIDAVDVDIIKSQNGISTWTPGPSIMLPKSVTWLPFMEVFFESLPTAAVCLDTIAIAVSTKVEKVKVVIKEACSEVVVSTVDHRKAKSMLLYPNPVVDHVSIEMLEEVDNDSYISVYSTTGRLVVASICEDLRSCSLYVGDLQSGIYVIKVNTAKETFVSRFIKS